MENNITVNIHFLGASGTVTGSKFIIETPHFNIMVECGMFQGLKELRLLNWEPFPFPPEKIDVILLTHGHLDHTGYLPRLVRQGYKGNIMATAPTLDIAAIILLDSAKIHEEDAARAREEESSIHHPPLPFYTVADAEKAIRFFKDCKTSAWIELTPDIKFKFERNGHILGSCYLELDIYGKIFLFSGDVGRDEDLLLDAPTKPERADYLFLESTYGNRLHPENNTDELLITTIIETLENNGNIVIPCFAVERMQTLMYKLYMLAVKKEIPNIPIYVDSPMGNNVLEVFMSNPQWHKINPVEFGNMIDHFQIITSYKETWETIDNKKSKIIIAGSGMVTGGRVLTYLQYLIDKPETTILLTGFQAEGTRGRELQEGVHEIKIFGTYYPVKAKIKNLHSLSAHADQDELLNWISELQNSPEEIFLIHGEKPAADALRVKIKDTYNWKCHIPNLNEEVTLNILPPEEHRSSRK